MYFMIACFMKIMKTQSVDVKSLIAIFLGGVEKWRVEADY